ncbi:DNA replication licensing factor mcm6 [Verticillium alfalfae VaMs.102]|uniref:DNA replication licensing factor MCM6 n=1 Tax=Verticillium alfalfae (strain VaMs.102 / ATCC MYA-4576 / FGSC 10136) TaxID=526221 RepID=C9STR6_VERA1|nr:DNA replication licensing factor mcm6 [Verticillium alfalfae VaMs.102]EEY22227.1 DNA replication licensing factor mcm6 [Verticillium alfalfae VaMs.102]
MASSEAGYPMSDRATTPTARRYAPPSSSTGGRLRGPPSEMTGAPSDDEGDGFADDQVVRGSKRPQDSANIPKVEDRIGLLIQEQFGDFLEGFVEERDPHGAPPSSAVTTDKYYVAQIHGMRTYQLSTLYVDFRHLGQWQNGSLSDAVATNYYRFLPFITAALHGAIAKHEPQYFREHRQPTASSNQTSSAASNAASASQSELGSKTSNQQTDKLFAIAFYNLPLVSRVRSLRAANIGQLLSISGTVTRTSEVRPELSLGTFLCQACRTVIPNVEQTFRYTEPTLCPNQTCQNRFAWQLDIRQSTFIDWQKVRIQENSSEIPTGSMPRTMDVIMRGEIVDRAKAGEKCIFTGALIVVPDVSQLSMPGQKAYSIRDDKSAGNGNDAGGAGVSGLKSLGVRDLTYRLAFLACMVLPDNSSSGRSAHAQVSDIMTALTDNTPESAIDAEEAQATVLATMTQEEIAQVRTMVHTDRIYSRLVNSIAPMVYGHEVVKKATLNARTSILAAANPVSGRYNRKTSLRANINMSAPIMSRFDLFFVVLDECSEAVDRHLAEHIVAIHQLRDEAVEPEYDTETLQRYIRLARTFRPEFTEEARETLVEKYKELRADDAQGGVGKNSYRITVRQLESMIRLSEAIAKANCVNEIEPHMVVEAMVNLFVQRVNDDEAGGAGEGVDGDALTQWYLEQAEDQMEGEEDYHREKALAALVLKKMVKENILMAVRGSGLAEDGEDAATSGDGAVVYVLHPNCAVEEY